MRLMPQTALIGLLSVAFALTACSGGGPANSYTITGWYLTNETPNGPTGVQTLDPSTATITLSIETETEAGEVVTTEIESKAFDDGKVEFSGRIQEPTIVEIAVELKGEEQDLTSRAKIDPGTAIEFAFINLNRGFRQYRLAFVGRSSLVEDEEKKYSISGDLNQFANDSQFAILSVGTWNWTDNNELPYVEIASVVLDKGHFLIERQIDEPIGVEVVIDTSSSSYAYTPAIIEPNTNITITAPGSSPQAVATMPVGWFDLEQREQATERQASANILLATAGTGRHARLIESWQRSFEYLAKLNELDVAQQEWRARQERQHLRTVGNTQSSGDVRTNGGSADGESPSWSAPDLESAPAAECEHVDLLAVRPFGRYIERTRSNELPPHAQIRNELWKLRTDTLRDIAFNSRDAMDSLLALEMGLESDSLAQRKRVLARLDDLRSLLDEELFARRVAARRNSLAIVVELEENGTKSEPGQKALEFTLPNLNGELVSLTDLVQQNDTLLLLFARPETNVAYWQYRFDALQEIRAKFGKSGFDIVSIFHSSDPAAAETWQSASEEYGIVWFNLGEFGSDLTESVANSYGAMSGQSYLLDSQGCITQRDLTLADLRSVLADQYGESPLEN